MGRLEQAVRELLAFALATVVVVVLQSPPHYATGQELTAGFNASNPQTLQGPRGEAPSFGGVQSLSLKGEGQGEASLTLANPRDNTPAHITVEGEGLRRSLTLPPGGKTGFPVEPGRYTITIRLDPPESTIGDPRGLTVERLLTVPPGGRAVILAPRVDQMLARLVLGPFPASVVVRVEWDGGSTTIRLRAGEAVVLGAVPGTYRVEVSRADWLSPLAETYRETLTLGQGDLARVGGVNLSPSPLRIAALTAGISGALALLVVARRRR